MKNYSLFLFFLLITTFSSGQNIITGEYFINTDPGVGNGTSFSLSNSPTVSDIVNISTTSLNAGFQTIYIRVKDNLGRWSHCEKSAIYILKNSNITSIPPKLVAGEFFINTDPGVGNGTAFSISNSSTISEVITIPTTSLTPGFHTLFIRVKDSIGRWSHYESSSFYILENASVSSNAKFKKGEYFIDNDPGIGNGTTFTLPIQSTLSLFPISVNVASLADGDHSVHFRLMDENGKWSHYETNSFYICGDLIDNPTLSGSTTFCQGGQIKITGIPVNNISSFYWTGPNNYLLQSIILIRNNATPDMSGTYTFNVVSQGGYHCDTNSISVNVTINPSYNKYQQTSLCYGDTLKIANYQYYQSGFYTPILTSITGCDSMITISLNVLPKNTRSQVVQMCIGQNYTIGTHTYSSNGTYIDTLTTPQGCDSIVKTNLSFGDPIINTQISFTDSVLISQATDVTYEWLDCDDGMNPIPNETSSQLHLTKNGHYAVRLTSTLCPTITATSNCYNVYNLDVTSTTAFENVKVFPNPNKGLLYVETSDFQNVQIEITDLQGRLLYTSKMSSPKVQLQLENYAAGTYLLKLSKNQVFNIYKIVKE